MAAGQVPGIEIVEQFARAFGEDVNLWRERAGHSVVEDSRPPLARIREAVQELTYELDPDALRWAGNGELGPDALEILGKIAAALRDETRGIAE